MRQGVLRTRAVMTAVLLTAAILLLWSGTSSAAPPTLGADCGAGASIMGSDSAGKVEIGTGGYGSACTLTFTSEWANAPACTAVNETNGGANSTPIGTMTTRTTVVIGGGLPWVAGDVVSYICVGY